MTPTSVSTRRAIQRVGRTAPLSRTPPAARRGCAADVLKYIARLELGAEVNDALSFEIDLVAPTEWDLDRIRAMVTYKRRLAAEAIAEVEAFERFLPVLERRRAEWAAGVTTEEDA